MPSLWNEDERAAIVARVNRLTPQHQRAWGKMETSQVLAHLADGLRIALGDIPTKQQGGLMSTARMRYLIIHKALAEGQGESAAGSFHDFTAHVGGGRRGVAAID